MSPAQTALKAAVIMPSDETAEAAAIVEKFLTASMVPDPETAARYVAAPPKLTFTGGRKFSHPRESTAFNAQRYKRVTKAMERRDTTRNKAEEQALRKVKASESDRSRAIHLAEAERTETRRLAEAQRAYFLSRLRARDTVSVGDEVGLLLAAADEVTRGRSTADAYGDYRRRRQERVALNARLVEFRAFWDTVGRALNGREKIIFDADKVPGRRQLMLFDPDRFRLPVPMLPGTRRTGETHEGP